MNAGILFLFAIICLLVHEMDAVRGREWVIFPGLSRLPEEKGYLVFTLAHIPLIYLVFFGNRIGVAVCAGSACFTGCVLSGAYRAKLVVS